MEIVVALLGLVGAILGLLAAILPRKYEITHRHDSGEKAYPRAVVRSTGGTSAGALACRSTLLGFAIGTFFGVVILSAFLIFGKRLPHGEALDPDTFRAGVIALILSGVAGTWIGLRTGMKLAALAAREETVQETSYPTVRAGSIHHDSPNA